MKYRRLSGQMRAPSLRPQKIWVCSCDIEPQSNGGAENAVKTSKKILSKSTDPNLCLIDPLESGFLPAELLFGRKLRTTLPHSGASLQPQWNPDSLKEFRDKDHHIRDRNKRNYDSHHGVYKLAPLHPGTRVWIPDLHRYGKVIQLTKYPRSYMVDSGTQMVRHNRRQLLHRPKGKSELYNPSADEEASPPGRNTDQRAPTPRSHIPPTNMRHRSLWPSSPQEEDFLRRGAEKVEQGALSAT
ncbi:hypothetical protein PR048_009206 [Dryococelus australis]|uniref:Uncharacterized protein n=1 Tax=Dryococelus australis TaxID=614101 RepID=A0ABQ9I0B7_9NEOP|nr:hypothetical protein PR048_009206 [Dryococelus australis]